jgi:Ca-activated chloride channel family protein
MSRVMLVALAAAVLQAEPAAAFDLFSRVFEPVEQGNQRYQEQHYDQALDEYERAEQLLEREPRIHFNRGDALFKLGRFREARDAFLRATGSEDPGLKKKNYYNIGNTFLSEGGFRDAITYYRRALEIDPGFDDARFNLELALRAIQQQQQQQKEGDSGQQKDDGGQQEKKQDEGDKQQDQEGSKEQQQEKEKQDEKEDQQQEGDQQQQDQKEQQEKDQQQQKDGENRDDQEQKGDEQESQMKDQQEKQEQQSEQQQSQEQKSGKDDEKPVEMQKPPDPDGAKPKADPRQLSRAQIKDLLDAMRENEKPFQMDRFILPEYKPGRVEKDW